MQTNNVQTSNPIAPNAAKTKAIHFVLAIGIVSLFADMGLRLSLHTELPPEMQGEEARKLELVGKSARDVMSSRVTTVNIHARVPEAAALMAARKLKRLPVVDDSGDLCGILSRVDILRTFATVTAVADVLPPQLPQGLNLTAGDVMFRDIPTVAPDDPLDEALNKLVATPLRRVVVVDEGRRVVGIVLDRELIRRFSEKEKPSFLHDRAHRRALLCRGPALRLGDLPRAQGHPEEEGLGHLRR